MSSGKNFYVVWDKVEAKLYSNWEDAKEAMESRKGCRVKGFATAEEASSFYRTSILTEEMSLGSLLQYASDSTQAVIKDSKIWERFPEIDREAWAVDASCLGNPGRMEYRGVKISTGEEIFRVGPFDDATNNIGEFLAIVHALALMDKNGIRKRIYSDSISGIAWTRRRKANTRLTPTDRNSKVRELIERAEAWLHTHRVTTPIEKWDTERWGEIPADFGRK